MGLLRIVKKGIFDSQFDFSFPLQYIAVFTNPFYFLRKNLYENIKVLSSRLNGKVLDFGCGCKPYQAFFSHCDEYIGCDIDLSGHSHNDENIDVFYDGKHLPFLDDSFDGVFSTEVFEHIFNLPDILIELNRVMRINGYILLTVPFVWNEHEVPYDCARYTSYGISYILKNAGFEVMEYCKSTLYVELLFQMCAEFIRRVLSKCIKNTRILMILQMIFITPVTLCGIGVSKILPNDDTWYGDNIVLCKKTREVK